MAEPTWISTAALHPTDGQTVLAKSRHATAPQIVTFRQHPTPRWEHGDLVYQYQFFDHWALLPQKGTTKVDSQPSSADGRRRDGVQ